jgi:hypothetical protein
VEQDSAFRSHPRNLDATRLAPTVIVAVVLGLGIILAVAGSVLSTVS